MELVQGIRTEEMRSDEEGGWFAWGDHHPYRSQVRWCGQELQIDGMRSGLEGVLVRLQASCPNQTVQGVRCWSLLYEKESPSRVSRRLRQSVRGFDQ